MNTLEIFAGTKSFSKVMEKHGHETTTLDNDPKLSPDFLVDVLELDTRLTGIIGESVDILWASPPCQGFSVAAIGKNWYHDHTPKTESAKHAVAMVKKTIEIIEAVKPTWWFIENPRGKLRKMPFMEKFIRRTVTYCQYGDTRMKPTDIWTNAWWWNPKPPCQNGDGCHVSAPRGSSTGTQGIKGARDRGVIPPALFEEILEQLKNKKDGSIQSEAIRGQDSLW